MLFDKGKAPFLDRLVAHLAAEAKAGHLVIDDVDVAASQFLALIAAQSFWPEPLVPGCGGTDDEMAEVVEQAIAMMLARYGA